MKIGTIYMLTCDHDSGILWIQPESNPIAIIKQKVDYNDALYFCEKMCGILYEPTNFVAVHDGLSKVSKQHNLGDLFIGVKAVKNENGEVNFYYLSNLTYAITRESSEFIDNVLGAVIYMTKEVGEFPVLLDTDSNYRFNLWTVDAQPDKHSFVCQNDIYREEKYFGPTSKKDYNL